MISKILGKRYYSPVKPRDEVNVPDLEPGVLRQQDGEADAVRVELESADPGRGGDELGQPGDQLLGAPGPPGGDGGGHAD